jgi:hypothetical protein
MTALHTLTKAFCIRENFSINILRNFASNLIRSNERFTLSLTICIQRTASKYDTGLKCNVMFHYCCCMYFILLLLPRGSKLTLYLNLDVRITAVMHVVFVICDYIVVYQALK